MQHISVAVSYSYLHLPVFLVTDSHAPIFKAFHLLIYLVLEKWFCWWKMAENIFESHVKSPW